MGGSTGHTDTKQNTTWSVVYKGSMAFLGGAAAAAAAHLHFSGQNAQRDIGENAKLFKEYSALADKNSPQAKYMQDQLIAGVNPPHTTLPQDIATGFFGIGIGAGILAWGFRKSIKRYIDNGNDMAKGQSTRPQKPHNDLSL